MSAGASAPSGVVRDSFYVGPSTFPPPPAAIVKVCSCGQPHTARDLIGLKYIGLQDDGAGGWLVLRNCHCGSTMAVDS